MVMLATTGGQRLRGKAKASSRLTDGQFYTIMGDLRADIAKFLNYFRMSQESFNELLTLLGPYMQKANTSMTRSIPIEERLA